MLITFVVLVFLVLELRVSAAKLVVRHVAVDLPFVQVFHVGFIGEAGVSSDDSTLLIKCSRQCQTF